jgi:O-antigen/teichoic acid export membrane protein
MASGAVRSVGGQAGTAIFGVAVFVFLARLLAPEEMGVFLSITAAVAFSALAARLGLGPILTRAIATESARGNVAGVRSAVQRAAVAVVAASFVLGILTWLFLTRVVGHASVVSSLEVLAVGVLGVWICSLAMEGVVADGFRGLGEIGHAVWILRLAPLAIATGVYAIMLVLGIEVEVAGAVVIMTGSSVVTTVAGFLLLLSKMRYDPEDKTMGTAIALTRAFPVWVASLGAYAVSNLGLWAVIIMGVAVEVADFGISARLVAPIVLPLVAVNGFMTPIIASLHAEGDRVTLERALRSTTTASSLVSITGAVALVVLAPILLRVLFGPEYIGAFPVVVILTVGAVANVVSGSPGATLLMTGHQRVFSWITLAGVAVGTLFVAVGYRLGGVIGVAAATSLVTSIHYSTMVVVVRQRLGVWTVPYLRPRDAGRALRSLGGVSAVTARWRPSGTTNKPADRE